MTSSDRFLIGGSGCLMSNILSRSSIDGILSNIGRVVPYPLKAARNEDQIQVSPQLFWVLGHSISQPTTGFLVQQIQVLVPRHHCSPKFGIFASECVDGV